MAPWRTRRCREPPAGAVGHVLAAVAMCAWLPWSVLGQMEARVIDTDCGRVNVQASCNIATSTIEWRTVHYEPKSTVLKALFSATADGHVENWNRELSPNTWTAEGFATANVKAVEIILEASKGQVTQAIMAERWHVTPYAGYYDLAAGCPPKLVEPAPAVSIGMVVAGTSFDTKKVWLQAMCLVKGRDAVSCDAGRPTGDSFIVMRGTTVEVDSTLACTRRSLGTRVPIPATRPPHAVRSNVFGFPDVCGVGRGIYACYLDCKRGCDFAGFAGDDSPGTLYTLSSQLSCGGSPSCVTPRCNVDFTYGMALQTSALIQKCPSALQAPMERVARALATAPTVEPGVHLVSGIAMADYESITEYMRSGVVAATTPSAGTGTLDAYAFTVQENRDVSCMCTPRAVLPPTPRPPTPIPETRAPPSVAPSTRAPSTTAPATEEPEMIRATAVPPMVTTLMPVPVASPAPTPSPLPVPTPAPAPARRLHPMRRMFSKEEAVLYSSTMRMDLDVPCVMGGPGPRPVTFAERAVSALHPAAYGEWQFSCERRRETGEAMDEDPARGVVWTTLWTTRASEAAASPHSGQQDRVTAAADPLYRCPVDLVTATGSIKFRFAVDGITYTREVRFEPTPGELRIVHPPVIAASEAFSVEVVLCRESFAGGFASGRRAASLQVPIVRAADVIAMASRTLPDLGAARGALDVAAQAVFPTPQVMRLIYPPLVDYIPFDAAEKDTEEFDLQITPNLSVSHLFFTSGLAPTTLLDGDGNMRVTHTTGNLTTLRCPFGCGARGACVGGVCRCAFGWEGATCDTETISKAAASAVAGAGVAGWLLQAALGGSLLIPVHALTSLQLLYVASLMPCATDASRDATSKLKYIVFPTGLSVSGHEGNDNLAFAMALHAGLCVLHLVAVAVARVTAAAGGRGWSQAAEAVLFPNVSIVVLQCFIIPLVGGVLWADPGGVVQVVGAIYVVALAGGFVAGYVWLHRTRMGEQPPFAEYLLVNLNNTAENATRLLANERTHAAVPAGFREWLPRGFWTSQHLIERAFLRKYSTLICEFAPEGVLWCPFVMTMRLFALAALAHGDTAGCNARASIILAGTLLTSIAVAVWGPFHNRGSNVVSIALHAAVAAALIAVFWAGRVVVAALVVVVAVVLVASAWYIVSWYFAGLLSRRRRGEEAAAAPQYVARVTAAGSLEVGVLTEEMRVRAVGAGGFNSAVGPPSASISATHLALRERYAELRGMQLSLYADRADIHAEYRADMDLHTAVFEGGRCRLRGTGAHAGDFVILIFPSAAMESDWRDAIQRAAVYVEVRETFTLKKDGRVVNGGGEAVEAGMLLGWEVARIPQVDRIHCFNYYDATPIASVYGGYRQCTPKFSTTHSAADSYGIAGGGYVFEVKGEARKGSSSSNDGDPPQRLLMHGVQKAGLTSQQVDVWTAELAVLCHLNHPTLLKVSNAFETATGLYWTVPYCARGSLARRLEACGSLVEADAARIAASVLLGLEHLHENNLLFRNLASTDVMFAAETTVALSDPGLPWGRITKPACTAPEILAGGVATAAGDVWAAGCVVYEMLHGRPAFHASNPRTVAKMVSARDPDYNAGISADGKALLQAMLTKAPAARVTLAGAKAHPWFRTQGVDWTAMPEAPVGGVPHAPAAVSPQRSRSASAKRKRPHAPAAAAPMTATLPSSVAEDAFADRSPRAREDAPVNPLMLTFGT